MKKILILFLSFVFLFSDNAQNYFKEANQLYKGKKYKKALLLYNKIYKMNYNDPKLLYNMGNTCFKLYKANSTNNYILSEILNIDYSKTNQISFLAGAIYFYKKALLINPKDDNILKNLDFVNNFITDKIKIQNTVNPLAKALFFFYYYFSINTQFITGFIFFFIFFILFFIYILKKNNILRDVGIAFFVLSLIMFISTFVNYKFNYNKKEGVLVCTKYEVKTAPGEDEKTAFDIHAGITGEIKEIRGNWYNIVLKNGFSGWVKKDYFILIK